jgi:hypothetical protein
MVGRLTHRTFNFAGLEFPYFAHHYNCGHPPGAMSERSLELPMADRYLATKPRESVVEVGAVTPYYWPHRVLNVCDPGDGHPLANIKASYLEVDFTGKDILSISTFEHIGSGEYGLPPDPQLNQRAFEKLFREAASFLVTVPGGYNPHMDSYLLSLPVAELGISTRALVRVGGRTNDWEERASLGPGDLHYEYGAYCLIVISKNSFLEHDPR